MGRRKSGKEVYTENPEPINDQSIAKIISVRGGGVYECLDSQTKLNLLVSLAPVYQKRIWVKLGINFLIITF